jgi:hypothetical protein
VIGLYLHPPEHALVLCVDETSQIQALDRTQPLLPMRPHQVERRTHDYVRHGSTTLFAALDIATGQVTGRCYERHRRREFLAFLTVLDQRYPTTPEIHPVLDSYHTHKHPVVEAWLAEIRGSRCTSHRPVPAGSTRWRAGSRCCSAVPFSGASSAVWPHSSMRSVASSTVGTTTLTSSPG